MFLIPLLILGGLVVVAVASAGPKTVSSSTPKKEPDDAAGGATTTKPRVPTTVASYGGIHHGVINLGLKPPFAVTAPGGHARFKLRPTDDLGVLQSYYLQDIHGDGAAQRKHAAFTLMQAMNPIVMNEEAFLAARAAGATIILPGAWQPYARPIPRPNEKVAAEPHAYPPLPPLGPVNVGGAFGTV